MAGFVYMLCAATALLSAFLLLKSYATKKISLLLWSGLCFVGLGLNNVMLVVDRILLPEIDLSLWRLVPALIGMMLLLYGLIWGGD